MTDAAISHAEHACRKRVFWAGYFGRISRTVTCKNPQKIPATINVSYIALCSASACGAPMPAFMTQKKPNSTMATHKAAASIVRTTKFQQKVIFARKSWNLFSLGARQAFNAITAIGAAERGK